MRCEPFMQAVIDAPTGVSMPFYRAATRRAWQETGRADSYFWPPRIIVMVERAVQEDDARYMEAVRR